MTEAMPDELMFQYQVNEVIAWIRLLSLSPRDKKTLFIEWCKMVGLTLQAEWIQRLLGVDEPRARG